MSQQPTTMEFKIIYISAEFFIIKCRYIFLLYLYYDIKFQIFFYFKGNLSEVGIQYFKKRL